MARSQFPPSVYRSAASCSTDLPGPRNDHSPVHPCHATGSCGPCPASGWTSIGSGCAPSAAYITSSGSASTHPALGLDLLLDPLLERVVLLAADRLDLDISALSVVVHEGCAQPFAHSQIGRWQPLAPVLLCHDLGDVALGGKPFGRMPFAPLDHEMVERLQHPCDVVGPRFALPPLPVYDARADGSLVVGADRRCSVEIVPASRARPAATETRPALGPRSRPGPFCAFRQRTSPRVPSTPPRFRALCRWRRAAPARRPPTRSRSAAHAALAPSSSPVLRRSLRRRVRASRRASTAHR